MTKASQKNLNTLSTDIHDIPISSIVLPYLCGQDKTFTANAFITQAGEHITAEDFKKHLINADTDNQDILKILIALGINDQALQSDYLKNKNLYDLLCHLHRNNHKHLGALIHMIDSSKPKSNLSRLLLPTFMLSSLMAITAYLKEYQPNAFNFLASTLEKFETLLINTFRHAINGIKALTITSMGVSILTFLYEFVITAKDKKRNVNTKHYDLRFALAATMLTLTSYAITFASLGTMTVTAGTIFIASSFVSVIKHSISLYHAHKNYALYSDKIKEEIEALPPIEQAQYYRKLYEYRSERDTLILDVGVALLSTLIIASWTLALFFPPGLLLVAASFGALTAVQSVHAYAIQKRKNCHEDGLQSELRKINTNDKLIKAIEDILINPLDNSNDDIELTPRGESTYTMIETNTNKPLPEQSSRNPVNIFHGENPNGLFNAPPSMAEGKEPSQKQCPPEAIEDGPSTDIPKP